MHLLSTRPGGFVEDEGAVVSLGQTPAELVVLSSADTTLALLAAAQERLEAQAPGRLGLRLANLLQLRQPASIDLYVDEVLRHARVVVVDHLGAESAWPYGVQRLGELARAGKQQLAMFSGDLHEDENLLRKGTVPQDWARLLWRYLRAGGAENALAFLESVAFHAFGRGREPAPPRPVPRVALHAPEADGTPRSFATLDDLRAAWQPQAPVVALVFYRSHLQSGNTGAFDALADALRARGLNPLPIALDSLKDPVCADTVRGLCAELGVALLLNTTAFCASTGERAEPPLAGDAPVFQVIVSGSSREAWAADTQGLRPRDIAMQVALPEFDGRIITRAVSFKGVARHSALTQTDVVAYEADPERVAFVAELARRWCRLRGLPAADKRVALILANYPGSEGRIGSGVGLDTPAAVVKLLRLLRDEGYAVGDALPADGDALMRQLTAGIANDPRQWPLRPAWQSLPLAAYRRHLAALPAGMAAQVDARWGPPEADPLLRAGRFMVAGLRFGQVFVGIQPARSTGAQTYESYHDAELVPPHGYLAFHFWLREHFAVDAVVHVGKHGNLEWLPGKSLALSANCWPDAVLGPLPHLYPFIVNDPGEGAQAKRRTQAVIVDHLMPPLTRAESYGELQDLEREVDEYYDALLVDARRAALLRRRILERVRRQRLHEELGASGDDEALLRRVDAYLCELKETQIRDGLHVFGESPRGRQRRDTLLALARWPVADGAGRHAGLLQVLANDLLPGEGFDPLALEPARPWDGARPARLQAVSDEPWRHAGDTRERLEQLGTALLEAQERPGQAPDLDGLPQTTLVLERIRSDLAPRLDACGEQELLQFSRGLRGLFIPPGPSGSPSRGRPDVLPTGRNFYGIDTRAVPTPAAYALGVQSAAQLVEQHLQKHGDYPVAVGLSVWGTATLRTGGDDIAQAFALLGVRPRWAPGSHRVVDVEVLPIAKLGRPRIDVTLRISGFFRDAFPNVVQLFDTAVQAVVAQDDEAAADNPVRVRILREREALRAQGLDADEAQAQAGWRVFGCRPGHYGAGLQPLIDHGQWRDDADLAAAYVGWSAWAYGRGDEGRPAAAALRRRLADIDAVAQNQDNREHDLLDSGDYYQFQGGMAAAVRHLSGRQPALYHGDHANPQAPRVRPLREEIARVVRARVVNPKWIAGVKRHGYKGAYEMAATVDYLFGFDATARVVGDHQYEMLADAYLLDEATRRFVQQHNPQALSDMLNRLLEAMRRGLWQSPGRYHAALEDLLLAHEQHIEGQPR